MWAAAFDTVDFAQAVQWFRARIPITDDAYRAANENAREQAFWVAGVAHADIIRQIHESLGTALKAGTPFEEWKQQIAATLKRAWGDALNPAQQPARIETILRNWSQSSYSRARWQQMDEPAIKRLRPFRMFDAVRPTPDPTPVCTTWNGTILPADDPAWADHIPPLHHRCQSGIRCLTREKAERLGIAGRAPSAEADDGFGTLSEWKGPDRKKYPAKVKPPAPPKAKPKAKPPVKAKAAPEPTKPTPEPALMRREAERFAKAVKVEDGGHDLRALVRGQLAEYDPRIVSKDAAAGVGKEHQVRFGGPDLDAYKYNGFHAWDGEIVLREDYQAKLAHAAQVLKSEDLSWTDTSNVNRRAMDARSAVNVVRTVLHEELHGCSALAPKAYRGAGAALEEIGTELNARRALLRIVPELTVRYNTYTVPVQGYFELTTQAAKIVSDATGKTLGQSADIIADGWAKSSLYATSRMRTSPDAALRAWADALDVTEPQRQTILEQFAGLKTGNA